VRDLETPLSPIEALREDSRRRRRAAAENLLGRLAPEEDTPPVQVAEAAPAYGRAPALPPVRRDTRPVSGDLSSWSEQQISDEENDAPATPGASPPRQAVPPAPSPAPGAAPGYGRPSDPAAPPVRDRRLFPGDMSDADPVDIFYDRLEQVDVRAVLAQPLSGVAETLQIPARVRPAQTRLWDEMTPPQRAAVIDTLAEDPALDLGAALRAVMAPPAGEDSIDGSEGQDTLAVPEGASASITPDQRAALMEQPRRSLAARVVGDVALGATEAPGQIVGGMRDALYAGLHGIAEFDEWASDAMGLPRLQLIDPETDQWDVRMLSPEESDVAKIYLPDVADADTVTGGLVRGLSQFVTGFAAGGKALKGLGWLAGYARVSRAMTQAALADFMAFDGHEARLSDLVEAHPAFSNVVTAYLASDINDSELEGRLKNVLEGAGTDVLISGAAAALRGVWLARRVKAENGLDSYAEAAERLSRDPRLGDSVLPDTSRLAPPDLPMVSRAPATAAPDAAGRISVSRLGQDADPERLAGELTDYLDTPRAADAPAPRAPDAVEPRAPEAAEPVVPDAAEPRVPEAADPVAPDIADSPHVSRIEAEGGDVFINWARIETGNDVKALMQRVADMVKDEVDEARRGTRTHQDTVRAAQDEDAWQHLVERRQGQALNAEQTYALRQLWAASGERLFAAARAVANSPTAQNSFIFRRMMALHGAIQREVIAVRTETARAFNQWGIPAGPGELVARQMEEMVSQFGGLDLNMDMAKSIVAMADEGNLRALDKFVEKGWLLTGREAFAEYYTMSILSGIKTQARNLLGNTMMYAQGIAERKVAEGIGALRGTANPVADGEAWAMLHGSVSSLSDAIHLAGKAWRTGNSGYGIGKIDVGRESAFSAAALSSSSSARWNWFWSKPVISHGVDGVNHGLAALTYRALTTADEFFKTMNFRAELHAQAYRRTAQEMDAGALRPRDRAARMAALVEDPPVDMELAARDYAQVQTFTNVPHGAMGDIARSINGLRAKMPELRFIVPFVNTPGNIFNAVLERSPMAGVFKQVRADLRAGGARADIARAKFSLGTMAFLASYDYALNYLITGTGPSNAAERATLYRMGWRPNSLRAFGRYWSVQGVDPHAMTMTTAANLAEAVTQTQYDVTDREISEWMALGIGSIMQAGLDKSFLTGLSEAFRMGDDPRRYAEGYFSRMSASLVPAIVRDVESMVDPTVRATSSAGQRARARIPGLSGDLPASHDLWGRPISYESGLGRVYDAIMPFYSSKIDPEPIDEEMMRLSHFKDKPDTTIQLGGERFGLRNRPDVYQRYLVLQGATPASEFEVRLKSDGEPYKRDALLQAQGDRTLLEALNDLVTGKGPGAEDYDSWAPEKQTDAIDDLIAAYREGGKRKLFQEYPEVFRSGGGRRPRYSPSPFAGYVEVPE
jgi:hypothetical protein